MSELRDFVADLLERKGAAVDAAVDPDELEVLAPTPMQKATGWPELTRLGFGRERSHGAIPIGLEGDWLDRFGALLEDEGRWSERAVQPVVAVPAPSDPERVLDRALDLPNAVWRFQGMTATWTRCLLLTFRYTAVSDEKREGLIWLGFNLGTGAVVSDILARLRPALAQKRTTGSRPIRQSGSQRGLDGVQPSSKLSCDHCSINRYATARSPSCASCAAGLSATATACTPITTTCAAHRSSAWRRSTVPRETARRPTDVARRCGSKRSSANIAPSSTTCCTITPCASASNGCRHWTYTCRCNVSRY